MELQASQELIELFPFHDEGDCCAESYVPFFETAAGRVAEACSSFVPQ
jgi:Zn-finger protein